MNAQDYIRRECEQITQLLLDKNRKYGNSALDPVRLFSKADPVEQIKVRLDDKLSRIRSGQADDDEDAELDMIGYLILLRVARGMEKRRVAAAAERFQADARAKRRELNERLLASRGEEADGADEDDGLGPVTLAGSDRTDLTNLTNLTNPKTGTRASTISERECGEAWGQVYDLCCRLGMKMPPHELTGREKVLRFIRNLHPGGVWCADLDGTKARADSWAEVYSLCRLLGMDEDASTTGYGNVEAFLSRLAETKAETEKKKSLLGSNYRIGGHPGPCG